ncbi:MAG TPA: DUF952 domain-containing protein [Ferruginibacter sp.]|nr:DUF952 domain-containing protein [Ferruginibacter sp.]HMP21890.1 DUF952 domain-containing protein [Ferruginibacter sp.]
MIYHVVHSAAWQQAKDQGWYAAPSLHTEGFIHASKQEQVAGVLQRYYSGGQNLLLLHIDETKLTAPLLYELAPSVNEMFPHIYGRLNIDAVTTVTSIDP